MSSPPGRKHGNGSAAGAPDRAGTPPAPGDTPMTGIYIAVIVVEAIIIAALWALGRMYS